MPGRIAYRGEKFVIVFAREKSGSCPAGEFFDGLSLLDKAKLMALFRIAADHGSFSNPEKFGVLGEGLYEFKSFEIRMPFAYANKERAVIVVTHGFRKKRAKTPEEEIARARRIFNEDQGSSGLRVVKRTR